MIFNRGDEEEAIKVLRVILSKITDENEHNAICFSIECLKRLSGKDKPIASEEKPICNSTLPCWRCALFQGGIQNGKDARKCKAGLFKP